MGRAGVSVLAFAWSLTWPALLAGAVAILVTIAIERFGGIVGGVLGTLPTTIVPASLGLWDGDGVAFSASMGAVPAGMLLNALFLWLWRVVPPRLPAGQTLGVRLLWMTGISLGAWCVAALLLVLGLDLVDARSATAAGWGVRPAVLLGVGTFALLVLIGIAATWRPRSAPRGGRRVGLVTLLARGALAAAAIAAAVFLKDVGGPVAAGMASVFPAIFVTTMVSLWLSQGEAVPSGAVGPMMLGSASVGSFALLAAWAFPLVGPWLGVLVAWPLALVTTTLPAFAWLRLRNPSSAATP